MTLDELIAEGKALEKPCFVLSGAGSGAPAAYWGGTRSDIPEAFPPEVTAFVSRRHILTVDEALLSQIGGQRLGLVSLYEWTDRRDELVLRVERDHQKRFASCELSGDPLYATQAVSFPPFEALCLHGSSRVADWLTSLGLERYEYWKVPREIEDAYREHYLKLLSSLQRGADAIVGGWHQMWPEDNYYTPPELTYLLLTLRDAEPWYTVWHSPMSGACFARLHVS